MSILFRIGLTTATTTGETRPTRCSNVAQTTLNGHHVGTYASGQTATNAATTFVSKIIGEQRS